MTTTGNTTSFLPSLNDGEEGGGILAVLGISRTVPLTVGIALIFTFLLNAILTPRLDPREPPLAKPTIPLVGHIIDLMRYQANFHPLLSRRRFRDKQPIVTLQMLTGKMYAVWDPRLVSSSYKSKTLSTNPQIRAVISPLCQVSPETRAKLSDAKSDEMTNYMLQHVIPAALSGQGLAQMNLIAMAELCSSFHSTVGRFLGEGTEIKNFYLWTRRELCLATSKALYGDASVDPFRVHPEMEQALFDFESSIFKLALNLPLPWLVAPKGHRARQILQDGLRDYYLNKLHDGDRAGASEFVRVRAKTLRDDGILERDIPKLEIMLPFAAMSNTVPTMFWFLVFIFASPQERKERLRQEILDGLVTERTEGQVTFRMGQSLIEEKCPLLFACYRETLRITIHQVATRTVTEDTVLTGSDGREYLLKKDVVLQMAGSNGHKMEAWWGEDAETYRPERWLEQEYQRSSRAAYQPFGGGIHLCPGRFFAFAEMTTAVVMFLLGYDVEPLGGGQEWKLPKFRTGSLVDAVSKPMDEGKGFGISVRPKKGWEGVKFKAELA